MKTNKEKNHFEEINVKRINILDEDGTIRMAISNKQRFPAPLILEGRDVPRDGNASAGIVFYNDEGYECGGLAFSSRRTKENGREQSVLLAFDPYLQNDVVDLGMYEKNGERTYALVFNDRPKKLITNFIKEHEEIIFSEDSPKKREYLSRLYKDGELGFERMKIEKSLSGEVSVKLSDSKGRQRISLAVDKDDIPKLEFLNEDGEVILCLPPDASEV